MSILALADRRISVYRRTALLLEPVEAAISLTPDRQPQAAALLDVQVSGGTSNTGSVALTGTVDGVPGTEATVVFAGPGRRTTTRRFTALSGITTSGFADEPTPPTISVTAVGGDGSPILASELLVSGWPARKDAGPPKWNAGVPGSAESEETYLFVQYTAIWTPRDGDVLVDDRTGEEWLVRGHPAQHAGAGYLPHHYEIRVSRSQGARLASG